MTVLIKIIQVIISLGLLIILHEGGHFLFAKLFKTRVNKFYLFRSEFYGVPIAVA